MISCGTMHFANIDYAPQAGPVEQRVYQALRSYNSGPGNLNPANLDSIGSAGNP